MKTKNCGNFNGNGVDKQNNKTPNNDEHIIINIIYLPLFLKGYELSKISTPSSRAQRTWYGVKAPCISLGLSSGRHAYITKI